MKEYNNPTVRGEKVMIIGFDETPQTGVLGAVVDDARILVQYPDGERGYVRESDIIEEDK
jgi:hypothetical protein